MKKFKLSDMKGGWFVGNFEPTVFYTKDFEASVRSYYDGEFHDAHYHAIATEINVVIEGSVVVNDDTFSAGDIFVVEPMETIFPKFVGKTTIVCIKTPSVVGDKYTVEVKK